jgi:hypothetical protein
MVQRPVQEIAMKLPPFIERQKTDMKPQLAYSFREGLISMQRTDITRHQYSWQLVMGTREWFDF